MPVKSPAPSQVARKIANDMWPALYNQYRCGKGVYGFSGGGHGGVVAVHGEASIPEEAWQAARDNGLVQVVVYNGRNWYTQVKYNVSSDVEAERAQGLQAWEVWVAEEDCDWATIFFASRSPLTLLQGAIDKGYLAQGVTLQDVEQATKNYNPGLYEALTGSEIAPGDSSAKDQAAFEAEHAEDWILVARSGDWQENVPAGHVGIMATKGGGRTAETWKAARYFLATEAQNDAIDAAAAHIGGMSYHIINPADLIEVGPDYAPLAAQEV